MKLYLYGHDYKYAAEQMLLTLFPAQRPEYPAAVSYTHLTLPTILRV